MEGLLRGGPQGRDEGGAARILLGVPGGEGEGQGDGAGVLQRPATAAEEERRRPVPCDLERRARPGRVPGFGRDVAAAESPGGVPREVLDGTREVGHVAARRESDAEAGEGETGAG